MAPARIGSIEAVEHDIGHAGAACAVPQVQLTVAAHGVAHRCVHSGLESGSRLKTHQKPMKTMENNMKTHRKTMKNPQEPRREARKTTPRSGHDWIPGQCGILDPEDA